jgi:hypothetical protein
MKAAQDQEIFNSLSPEQRDLLRRFTPAIVDTVLHHFLWMLDERPDVKLSVDAGSGTVSSLREVSDGLSNELYSDVGWIARFSRKPRSACDFTGSSE